MSVASTFSHFKAAPGSTPARGWVVSPATPEVLLKVGAGGPKGGIATGCGLVAVGAGGGYWHRQDEVADSVAAGGSWP